MLTSANVMTFDPGSRTYHTYNISNLYYLSVASLAWPINACEFQVQKNNNEIMLLIYSTTICNTDICEGATV